MLEGAAAGRPVVATGSATGAGVLVDGETGVLVPAGHPAPLAGAVAGLLRDEERRRRLGDAARRLAEERFDAAVAAARIAAVYEEALGR